MCKVNWYPVLLYLLHKVTVIRQAHRQIDLPPERTLEVHVDTIDVSELFPAEVRNERD